LGVNPTCTCKTSYTLERILYCVCMSHFYNPLQIILAVSTKLQAILTRMALGITERHAVVQGIPLVHGSDKYFWFNRPQLLLHLLHFALFQVLALFSVPNKTTIACYIYLSSTFVPCCLNAPSFCIECFPANILLLGLGNNISLYSMRNTLVVCLLDHVHILFY
jgi:hypothetical protein